MSGWHFLGEFNDRIASIEVIDEHQVDSINSAFRASSRLYDEATLHILNCVAQHFIPYLHTIHDAFASYIEWYNALCPVLCHDCIPSVEWCGVTCGAWMPTLSAVARHMVPECPTLNGAVFHTAPTYATLRLHTLHWVVQRFMPRFKPWMHVLQCPAKSGMVFYTAVTYPSLNGAQTQASGELKQHDFWCRSILVSLFVVVVVLVLAGALVYKRFA